MSIFSRRTIQRCLDENASFLAAEQNATHARILNLCNQQSLATEWEVVLLNAFSKVGIVQHEPGEHGKSKPDLSYRNAKDPTQALVAEITTVSDKQAEDDNPYEYLHTELIRIIKKQGINPAGLGIHVEGDTVGDKYTDRKMELHLPPKSEITQFINHRLMGIVKDIKDKPNTPHRLHIKDIYVDKESGRERDIDVTITYDPNERRVISGGRPSFTVPYSVTRNPPYSALTKKARQLRKVNVEGVKGVICCDGNCNILSTKMRGASDYSRRDIVQRFFENNRSVGFVVLVWVEMTGRGIFDATPERAMINREIYISNNTTHGLSNTLCNDIDSAIKCLPEPRHTALNASYRVHNEAKYGGDSFRGGYRMGGNKIVVSSRALTELLAGKVKQADLYPSDQRSISAHAFFNRQIAEGRVIVDIRVEPNADHDDDWVEITYGNPDAAISPFKVIAK